MKTHISFTLLLMVATTVCRGQTSDIVRNGYWWQGISPQFKLGFVSGYVLATGQARDIAALRCLAEHGGITPGKPITDAVINACETDVIVAVFVDYGNIRFGQLLEGTDEFYKDFRNKNLQIGVALHYVRDQLKGVSAKKLEEELTDWRRTAAN